MLSDGFVDQVRWHTAQTSVGPSTLRNTGAKGTVAAARHGLYLVKLERLADAADAADFAGQLSYYTERVRRRLPVPARRWGSARKALDIYLRSVLYNAYLTTEYNFTRVEQWLEIPLDSFTVRGLSRDYKKLRTSNKLPRFPGVAAADFRVYAAYQEAATKVAAELYDGISRVHLDIYYWRSDDDS